MTDVSSVEIRLNGGKPVCILDGSLALDVYGPLLSHRLARHWPVWIVRSLWPLIDSDYVYFQNPRLLDPVGGHDEPGRGKTTAQALSEWHALWVSGRLNGSFHWVGDVRHESNLPSDVDDLFAQRFEVLSAALLDKLEPEDDERVPARNWRETCAYEAIALAAALSDRPAVILTIQTDADRTPSIIHLLRQLDIKPERLPSNSSGRIPITLPDLALVGMPALLLNSLRLVAVHVSAPKALTLPWGTGGAAVWGDAAPELAGPGGPLPDPWAGATAAWHPLI